MIDQFLTLLWRCEGFGVVLRARCFVPCWFCNGDFAINLILKIFGGFDKLGGKNTVSGLLILRETWSTLDKNPPKRLGV